MTPTLMDVVMLTGLNITATINPYKLRNNFQHQLQTKGAGGWSAVYELLHQVSLSYQTASLAAPTISHSGKPIEYSTTAVAAPGHGAPSPSEYIKNFAKPPSPLRRLKRKKRTSKVTKKKAKIAVEAIPMVAISADIDTAIDAGADEQLDDGADQQTATPQPPPASTTTSSPLKTGSKHKVITHQPCPRKPKPSIASAFTDVPTSPADPVPEPMTSAEEIIVPTTTPI
uniref:Uncharacterized protein n=1 Tax=Oryza brachyantha TaxID=4533 RepID=J3LBN0_ORYBR